jgi:hypothetical protein
MRYELTDYEWAGPFIRTRANLDEANKLGYEDPRLLSRCDEKTTNLHSADLNGCGCAKIVEASPWVRDLAPRPGSMLANRSPNKTRACLDDWKQSQQLARMGTLLHTPAIGLVSAIVLPPNRFIRA